MGETQIRLRLYGRRPTAQYQGEQAGHPVSHRRRAVTGSGIC